MSVCHICGRMQVVAEDNHGNHYCEKHSKGKVCRNCHKWFLIHNHDGSFCSRACKSEYLKKKYSARMRDYSIVECSMCDNTFYPRTANQKYCSPECALKALKTEKKVGRFVILARDNFTCAYCGESSYVDGKRLHVDHIVPRKRGGSDTAANLITTCIECNLGKSCRQLPSRVEATLLQEVARRNEAYKVDGDMIIQLGCRNRKAIMEEQDN